MKLTMASVEKLPFSTEGRQYFYDDSLTGFGLVVSPISKTFFAQARMNAKVVRVKIGKFPNISPDLARKIAKEKFGEMAQKINPNEIKKEERVKAITLEQAFKDYKKSRKELRPRTIEDYDSVMKVCFGDWKDRLLTSITKENVEKKHQLIGEGWSVTDSETGRVQMFGGQARANTAMKILRAIFNFSMGKYENSEGQPFILYNPVQRLSQSKSWYRVDRRQSIIKADDIKAFWEGLWSLKNDKISNKRETVRDYLILLLLTGLRRQEGASLRWDDVDLAGKTLTVRETKNHTDHILPVGNYVIELLTRRKKEQINDFVFSGSGEGGFIQAPKKQIKKVIETSEVQFMIHDLRRTFITIAEGLDIPAYTLKKLLNHSMKNDVTAGYLIWDPERLRVPMQKIENRILKLTKGNPKGQVVPLIRTQGVV